MNIAFTSLYSCSYCLYKNVCKKDNVTLPPGTIVKYPCGYTTKVPEKDSIVYGSNVNTGYISNKE